MKFLKKILLLLGIIAVAAGLIYGYLLFNKYSVEKQLDLAKSCYANGDLSSAVEYLHNVWEKTPDSPAGMEALYLLAKCYLSLDELGLARTYWEKLENLPEAGKWQAECLFNLAIIDKETGNVSSALENYEKLIKEYPQSDLADDSLWNLALIYRAKGKPLAAKRKLDTIIEEYSQSNLISSAQKELGKVNIKLLFSPIVTSDSQEYIVEKGDTLAGIAKKYNTTVDLIKASNNLKSNFIKPGDRLKVIPVKFSIVVDKSRNTLILKAGEPGPSFEIQDEKVIKIYPVGTGKAGSTPVGEFKITNKLINPPWHKAGIGVVPYGDPENILGTRWLGLDITGYGIHGTWAPDTIGTQASAGCIRMLNEDLEELFKIVPVGTGVTVVE